ncbi:hypothetical protein M8C21_026629, partial [Ambrosia artemisiifolia]
VGTVLNIKDAETAKNAGAKFIMSPAIGILDQDSDDLLYIPGVMTPTEVYPVSAIGGVQYIATLKKPFPHIPIVASQGITTVCSVYLTSLVSLRRMWDSPKVVSGIVGHLDSVGAYIDGGASAVVLSDAIFDKKAISQRNFTAIYHLARLAALQGNAAVKRKEKIYPG